MSRVGRRWHRKRKMVAPSQGWEAGRPFLRSGISKCHPEADGQSLACRDHHQQWPVFLHQISRLGHMTQQKLPLPLATPLCNISSSPGSVMLQSLPHGNYSQERAQVDIIKLGVCSWAHPHISLVPFVPLHVNSTLLPFSSFFFFSSLNCNTSCCIWLYEFGRITGTHGVCWVRGQHAGNVACRESS